MARKFRFDDEDDFNDEIHTDDSQFEDDFDLVDNSNASSKVSKRKIKVWQIVLIVILLIFVAFFGYIYLLTNNDGPVFGNRCDGVTAINVDAKTATINSMKEEYSSIKDMTIEIVCKTIKMDITFEDGMKTSDAIKIAEKAVATLDDNVGLEKEDGKTYSPLLGYIKNEAQYDCQLMLISENSDDFPINGTKHHSSDEFSYTYASVKDEESKDKAESTLE